MMNIMLCILLRRSIDREKDLIAATVQRLEQRLAGKEVGCPNLARFENVTDAVL